MRRRQRIEVLGTFTSFDVVRQINYSIRWHDVGGGPVAPVVPMAIRAVPPVARSVISGLNMCWIISIASAIVVIECVVPDPVVESGKDVDSITSAIVHLIPGYSVAARCEEIDAVQIIRAGVVAHRVAGR